MTIVAPDPSRYRTLLDLALGEDIGSGDVTASLLPNSPTVLALRSREDGVLAGSCAIGEIFRLAKAHGIEGQVRYEPVKQDGSVLRRDEVIGWFIGPQRDLLSLERTILNLVTHLSGIATETARYVAEVEGTGAVIRDTRKTMPGLRELEKYAVRCGGGSNHRMGLFDAVLVKDNHVGVGGDFAELILKAQAKYPTLPLEVEVDTLDQYERVKRLGPQGILLDNMTVDEVARAVKGRVQGQYLEASGGLTLANVSDYGATGVDYLAIGALTHSARALDLGLDAVKDEGLRSD